MTPLRCQPHVQDGHTLIELLVGAGVTLAGVALALLAWGHQLRETRLLLADAALGQALQTTGEAMARNLRRAGHWAEAEEGVWQVAGSAVAHNPYPPPSLDQHQIEFGYSLTAASRERITSSPAAERHGYRLQAGVVEMRLGQGSWQAMTDPEALVVTALDLALDHHTEALGRLCADVCPGDAGGTHCVPMQTHRVFRLTLRAHARRDTAIAREWQSGVQLRNDGADGNCNP